MMKMYLPFMRILYIALCVLIATPSVSFCGWQQMVRALGTKLLKHADKFVAAYAFNTFYEPQITPDNICWKLHKKASPLDDFPHVHHCAQDICEKLGVSQTLLLMSWIPTCATSRPYPTIYLNEDDAIEWEQAFARQESDMRFPFVRDRELINTCKATIYHEAGHIRNGDNKEYCQLELLRPWIDTGIYSGLTSLAKACASPFLKMPLLLAHFFSSSAYVGCWHASKALTELAMKKRSQYVEFRADDAIPATPAMIGGLRSIVKDECARGASRIERFVDEQLSTHPMGKPRVNRIVERYKKAAKERVATYHDTYKSAYAAVKI